MHANPFVYRSSAYIFVSGSTYDALEHVYMAYQFKRKKKKETLPYAQGSVTDNQVSDPTYAHLD